MDSITRIKNFIENNFPNWEKIDFTMFGGDVDWKKV